MKRIPETMLEREFKSTGNKIELHAIDGPRQFCNFFSKAVPYFAEMLWFKRLIARVLDMRELTSEFLRWESRPQSTA